MPLTINSSANPQAILTRSAAVHVKGSDRRHVAVHANVRAAPRRSHAAGVGVMERMLKRAVRFIAVAVALIPAAVMATPIHNVRTESNIDWTSAAIGGVGGGSGTIHLTGVS